MLMNSILDVLNDGWIMGETFKTSCKDGKHREGRKYGETASVSSKAGKIFPE